MTKHRCRCGAGIFYDSAKQKEVACECGQEYVVNKGGTLQPIPPIEKFNLEKEDPFNNSKTTEDTI